jgi:hypothetical protein
LQAGATVYFGTAPVRATLVLGALYLDTPAHAAGAVDVVVRNPDGGAATVTAGFTYAVPTTFSFEGVWSGMADQSDGTHQAVEFTIENGRLTKLACDGTSVPAVSPAASIRDGELAYTTADGSAVLMGRTVSPMQAAGVIHLGACRGKTWRAAKV